MRKENFIVSLESVTLKRHNVQIWSQFLRISVSRVVELRVKSDLQDVECVSASSSIAQIRFSAWCP